MKNADHLVQDLIDANERLKKHLQLLDLEFVILLETDDAFFQSTLFLFLTEPFQVPFDHTQGFKWYPQQVHPQFGICACGLIKFAAEFRNIRTKFFLQPLDIDFNRIQFIQCLFQFD